MKNRTGRRLARKVLVAAGLEVIRDPESDELVILERGDAPPADVPDSELAELGRGETLLEAIEDSMFPEDEDEDDDTMADYGLALHIAASLAENGKLTVELIAALVAEDEGDGDTDPDPDDDPEPGEDEDEEEGDEESPDERHRVIELFPKKRAS